MFFFDRDEQRLEVSFAETFAAFSLQDLVEDRRAVLDRFGKDLQQIAFVVAVDQDAEAFEVLDVFVDLADAVRDFFVIGVGYAKKFDTVRLQFG